MSFLKFRKEKSSFHLLFLIFLELKTFQIKRLEEIFVCNLAPIFDSMNLLDSFQLIDLSLNSFFENFAGFKISSFQKPL